MTQFEGQSPISVAPEAPQTRAEIQQEHYQEQHNSLRKRIGAAIVVGALAVVSAIGVYEFSGDDGASTSDKVPEDVVDILRVKSPEVDCVSVVKATSGSVITDSKFGSLIALQVGSTKAIGEGPDQRRFTDAVNSPLPGDVNNPLSLELGIEATICETPDNGIAIENQLSKLNIGGQTVGDINSSWMKGGDASTINDQAESYLPQLKWSDRQPTKKQATEAAKANKAWQKRASYINTLLRRFYIRGAQTHRTKANISLAVGGEHFEPKGIPEFQNNPVQYDALSQTYQVVLKDGTCVGEEFGINLLDIRPNILIEDCVVPTTTSTTSPNTTITIRSSTTTKPSTTITINTPTTTSNPTTTTTHPTTTTTSSTTTTTTTTTLPPKDPPSTLPPPPPGY
jgi:hypothetical protein